MDLQGKNALVTGAARRVGREIAWELARRGVHVVVHYHTSREEAFKLVAGIRGLGVKSVAFRADLAKGAEIQKMLREVRRRFGSIDILVNNAANFLKTPLKQVRERDWDRSFDLNLKAPFFLAKEFGLTMKRKGGGTIINIADWAGIFPYRHYLPHSISKAGLIFLTKGLSRLLSPQVSVFAIAPRRLRSFKGVARRVALLAGDRRFRSGRTYSVDGRPLVG